MRDGFPKNFLNEISNIPKICGIVLCSHNEPQSERKLFSLRSSLIPVSILEGTYAGCTDDNFSRPKEMTNKDNSGRISVYSVHFRGQSFSHTN